MTSALQAAKEIIEDQEYVKNWFGAENFFGTVYTSETYTGDYFITCDDWMGRKVWAARHISPDGITTIHSGSTKESCIEAIKADR